ncbi:hypothetical protein AAC387_Pa02g3027 [Persea americana]
METLVREPKFDIKEGDLRKRIWSSRKRAFAYRIWNVRRESDTEEEETSAEDFDFAPIKRRGVWVAHPRNSYLWYQDHLRPDREARSSHRNK